MESIGVIAYGMYLFHEPILGLCYAVTRGTLPVMTDFFSLLITSCSLLVTIVLAGLSWLYLEKPPVRLGHKHLYVTAPRNV